MSVFNNGFLGFAEQIDGIQQQLDEAETLQTANEEQITTISVALVDYGWCSDWYTAKTVTVDLEEWISLLSPNYMNDFPYAGTYMLIGGVGVYAQSSDPIQQVEWQVWNQTTGNSKGIWYCSQGNNSLGVNSDYIGGNISIRFVLTEAELGDDIDVRLQNFSQGDNASAQITTFSDGGELKWRCVYLGPASPL